MKKVLIAIFLVCILFAGLQVAYAKSDHSSKGEKERYENKGKNKFSFNYTNYTNFNYSKYNFTSHSGKEKFYLCHKSGKKYHTIKVSEKSLKGHLKHGKDYIGKCTKEIKHPRKNETKTNHTYYNQSRIYLNVTSPIAKANYTNNTLLLNISYANTSSIWYNWNGTNLTYIGPVYINFPQGNNTLNVYANNSYGKKKSQVVKFFINSSIINNTTVTNQTV